MVWNFQGQTCLPTTDVVVTILWPHCISTEWVQLIGESGCIIWWFPAGQFVVDCLPCKSSDASARALKDWRLYHVTFTFVSDFFWTKQILMRLSRSRKRGRWIDDHGTLPTWFCGFEKFFGGRCVENCQYRLKNNFICVLETSLPAAMLHASSQLCFLIVSNIQQKFNWHFEDSLSPVLHCSSIWRFLSMFFKKVSFFGPWPKKCLWPGIQRLFPEWNQTTCQDLANHMSMCFRTLLHHSLGFICSPQAPSWAFLWHCLLWSLWKWLMGRGGKRPVQRPENPWSEFQDQHDTSSEMTCQSWDQSKNSPRETQQSLRESFCQAIFFPKWKVTWGKEHSKNNWLLHFSALSSVQTNKNGNPRKCHCL